MRKALTAAVAVLIFGTTGCVGPTIRKHIEMIDLDKQSLSQEQHDYLTKVSMESLKFVVPVKNAATEWERALYWISAYSGMKVQIANQVAIQTYNPPQHGFHALDTTYGYDVVRRPLDNGDSEITVHCIPTRTFLPGAAEYYHKLWRIWEQRGELNAKILAHYIQTGENREELVLKNDTVLEVVMLQ